MKKILVLAGGTGSRLEKKVPKQFQKIKGQMMIEFTLTACKGIAKPKDTCIVCHPKWVSYLTKRLDPSYQIISGGKTRIESTLIGLEQIAAKPGDVVFVVESNRPLIKSSWLKTISAELMQSDGFSAAMYADPVNESIFKKTPNGFTSLSKNDFFIGQTPYLFSSAAIKKILDSAKRIQDDSLDLLSVIEAKKVLIVKPDFTNIKVTTRRDFETIKKLL